MDLSTNYIFNRNSAAHIYLATPDPQKLPLIVNVREPVDRHFSHWSMDVKTCIGNDFQTDTENTITDMDSCMTSFLEANRDEWEAAKKVARARSRPEPEGGQRLAPGPLGDPAALVQLPFATFYEL